MDHVQRANRYALILLPVLLAFAGSIATASETGEDKAPMETHDAEIRTIFDFGADAAPWPSIDDVVMGGVSHSEMVVEDGVGVFRGVLSPRRPRSGRH